MAEDDADVRELLLLLTPEPLALLRKPVHPTTCPHEAVDSFMMENFMVLWWPVTKKIRKLFSLPDIQGAPCAFLTE